MYHIHKRYIFFKATQQNKEVVFGWSKFSELLFCSSGVLYNIRYAIPVCSFNELLQAVVKVLAQVLDVNCFDVISKMLPEPTKVCSGFFFISNLLLLVMMNIYSQISNQFNSFSLSSKISISDELSLVSGYKGNWIWKLRTKLKKSFKFWIHTLNWAES